MKRFLIIALACVVALCGCGKEKNDIKITSFEILSVIPQGLTNLDALIALGVDNPKVGFEISDVTGTVKMDGQPGIVITSDRVVIDGHSSKVYKIPFSGSLAETFNPFLLLNFLKDRNMGAFTVDLKLKVSMRGGIGKTLEFKDLSVEQLSNVK